jgi:hypothetical protein
VLGQRLHHRRDDDGLGDAVVLQRGQEPGHLEPGQRDQDRAAEQGPAGEHDQATAWKNDATARLRPVRATGAAVSICTTLVRQARWESITPLASPVVPLG